MELNRRLNDQELVKAIQAGGTAMDEAIRNLYRGHYAGLSQFVMSHGGNEQDAQDIFQETVLSFADMVQLGKYRGEASVKTMMFTINRNVWYTEVTKRGRREARNKMYVAGNHEEQQTVADYISSREARTEVMKLLDRLGESCKKILLLFYYENQSMKDILEHTGFENEQVVRNKKYKCLKQVEHLMKENPALYQQLKTALSYVR